MCGADEVSAVFTSAPGHAHRTHVTGNRKNFTKNKYSIVDVFVCC